MGCVGARYNLPDVDREQFGEISETVREVLQASKYRDGGLRHLLWQRYKGGLAAPTYEDLGSLAIFVEDQVAPKRTEQVAAVFRGQHLVMNMLEGRGGRH